MKTLTQGITAMKTANTILTLSSKDEEGKIEISPLKMQKLVYLSHGHYLIERGKKLVYDDFEAWSLGPVVPILYQKIKEKCLSSNGLKIVDYCYPEDKEWLPSHMTWEEDKKNFLFRVYEYYKNYTAAQLVDITHIVDGAWYKTYRDKGKSEVIEEELIREEFAKKELPVSA